MLQTQQHPVCPSSTPIKPSSFTTFLTQTASLTDGERHLIPLGSSPTSCSPRSPACSESPSAVGPPSPAKNGKKKARNRPPKHIRKGTGALRKSDDNEGQPFQQDCAGILAGDLSGAAVRHDAAGPAVDRQLAIPPSSRVVSAPINVPLRSVAATEDDAVLKLEAFSSPKWLGTGFADQMETKIPTLAGPRCSGPMIDTASGQFTYFANSMW